MRFSRSVLRKKGGLAYKQTLSRRDLKQNNFISDKVRPEDPELTTQLSRKKIGLVLLSDFEHSQRDSLNISAEAKANWQSSPQFTYSLWDSRDSAFRKASCLAQ